MGENENWERENCIINLRDRAELSHRYNEAMKLLPKEKRNGI